MTKTSILTIENKVFSKPDVLRLWKVFYDCYTTIDSDNKDSQFVFYCDNERHDFENIDMTTQQELIDIKKIFRIYMRFKDYRGKKGIELTLRTDRYQEGEINVSGSDILWVDSTYKKFQDIIESVKPQNTFFNKYEGLFVIFSILNIGYLGHNILRYIQNYLGYAPKTNEPNIITALIDKIPWMEYLFLLILIIFLGWLIFGTLYFLIIEDKLKKLWPSIEFDFGPEHLKIEKRTRNAIYALGAIIIIPLILQLIILLIL